MEDVILVWLEKDFLWNLAAIYCKCTGFPRKFAVRCTSYSYSFTAVDLEKEIVVMESNEAIYVENNVTSLMSMYQDRQHGMVVNDVARQHGGFQNILAKDLEVPLSVMNGLLLFDIRTPTEYERLNCTRVVMTGDSLWNIEDFVDDGCQYSNSMTTCDVFGHIFTDSPSHLLNMHTNVNLSQSRVNSIDIKNIQSKLGWILCKIVEKTLVVTTRLAKNHLLLPLRHHFKSRYPQLNRNRLRETCSTDTIFSSTPAINTNETYMQIFCGKVSKFRRGYSMTNESHGVKALEDFVLEVGVPYNLC